ncbi:hypothetical protein MNBD_GAMMA03-221 [hydrothermal vent metagenome]|uniref:Uncharacterized protein n=1 Tax=hydrothermal vent metagenome TaxID=652676 RepID=A0A3B0W2S0_9ZZZZ
MNKNKFELSLRHRANYKEPIDQKHQNFLKGINDLILPWNFKELDEIPDIGKELVAVINLNKLFKKGINGYLSYSYRDKSYLKDNAQYDDILILEFDPDVLDYSDLIKKILPIFIKAFNCYRATIQNIEIANKDWPLIIQKCNESGVDVDGRDGVFRINSVNYYDEELCQRAFNLTTDQVINRLKDEVESVYKTARGVVIIYSSQLLSQDDMLAIDSKIRSLLKI